MNEGWTWDQKERMGYPNTTADLRAALIANPHLQVLICQGRYDLATPWYAATWTRDHLGLPEALSNNVRLAFYEAGHMMYFHPPSLEQMRQDLVGLYARAVEQR